MAAAISLTPREVAELARTPKRAIEKAIEDKVLAVHARTGAISFGRVERRFLGLESVAYASLMDRLSGDVLLSLAAKKRLVRSLKATPAADIRAARVELAPSIVAEIGEAAGAAVERAVRYAEARAAWIETNADIKGGLPVIRGTRVTAHSLAARLEHGDSLEEIIADNPDLPRAAIEAAILFAKAHPLAGRPPTRHAM